MIPNSRGLTNKEHNIIQRPVCHISYTTCGTIFYVQYSGTHLAVVDRNRRKIYRAAQCLLGVGTKCTSEERKNTDRSLCTRIYYYYYFNLLWRRCRRRGTRKKEKKTVAGDFVGSSRRCSFSDRSGFA